MYDGCKLIPKLKASFSFVLETKGDTIHGLGPT